MGDETVDLKAAQNEITFADEAIDRLKAENERLREALISARKHINNGYQPPELINQIAEALNEQ